MVFTSSFVFGVEILFRVKNKVKSKEYEHTLKSLEYLGHFTLFKRTQTNGQSDILTDTPRYGIIGRNRPHFVHSTRPKTYFRDRAKNKGCLAVRAIQS